MGRAATSLGKLLVWVGLVVLGYRYVPWSQLPGYYRPLALVAAGLLMVAAGVAKPRVESLAAREAISLAAVAALAVATAAFISLLASASTGIWLPGPYQASKTRTLSESLEGVSELRIEVSGVSCDIRVHSWNRSEVVVNVTAYVRGASDPEAALRKLLSSIRVDSSRSDGTLRIEVKEEAQRYFWWWVASHIDVDVYVGNITSSIVAEAVSGDMEVELARGSVKLETTSGSIRVVGGMLEHVEAKAISGDIRVEGFASRIAASTTSGDIRVRLKPAGDCVCELKAVSGDIDVQIAGDHSVGCKVRLETMSGSLRADVPQMRLTVDESRRKVGETAGFDDKPIKVEVSAETTSGSISVEAPGG
ncbi:MAG: hypothetical protein DRN96_07600 [Thermoproteota archaeon]|nr:MAG: hypothetical protein DRN96_07600 [Candidatus Korarchaeota archaeon]RLG52504.1 MAG: hypothetical protein DRN99_07555 [Candidatus Korarchaeota archaeon]